MDPDGNFVLSTFLISAAIHTGWQALFATAETGVEYTAAEVFDDDSFSLGGSWLRNFGKNMLTGGIGGKLKVGGKVAQFALRQSIEIAGDTAYDVYQGRSLVSSLTYNTTGSLLGEGIGRVIGRGAKFIRCSVRVETPY